MNHLYDILKQLNEEEGGLQVGLFFKLTDRGNMLAAVDALLASGLPVDLAYSMGEYIFNFANISVLAEARRIVSSVINLELEHWS